MRITRECLEEVWLLAQRKKSIDQAARQLGSQIKVLLADIQEALVASQKTEITRGDYRARLSHGAARVSWKTELIRLAGAEKAQEIQQAADPPVICKVDRINEAADAVAKAA